MLAEQRDQLGQQVNGFQAQARAAATQRRSLQAQMDSTRRLAERGDVSRNTVRALERSLAELDGNNDDFTARAAAALQDIRKPTIIELKEMKARMTMDDQGAQAYLTAASGVFDSQKEQLELHQAVHVRTDNNQEAWLKSAKADFKAGTVSSREPVKVKMSSTTIEADTLDVTDNGRVISFVGRVRTVIESAAGAVPAAKAAPAAEAPARTSQAEPLSLRQ